MRKNHSEAARGFGLFLELFAPLVSCVGLYLILDLLGQALQALNRREE